MLKSIIHAGGESTRLREIFDGPKALAPIDNKTLIWFHLQPLLKSKMISEYIFTLRHKHDIVRDYLEKLNREVSVPFRYIVEPKPLGRAGVVRLGIENKIIDTEDSYIISHPDDLVPVDVKELVDYADEAERKNKSVVLIMAKHTVSPFGIGVTKKSENMIELKQFQEKPELPLIENHFANTGMYLFLPEAMKEFKNSPLDRLTHPEHDILPRLTKQNKVAVFLVERWLSVNYSSDYDNVLKMGSNKLLEFLKV